MSTWQEYKSTLLDHNLNSDTWRSDLNGLQFIFGYAENKGLSPDLIDIQKLSNLRAIVRRAKDYIEADDVQSLEELLVATKNMTNADLRLKLFPKTPQPVYFSERLDVNFKRRFFLALNEQQFERIRKSTRLFFKFIEKKEDMPR